ncbi:KdsC family phosphatase [Planctomycetes bacterium K23_9]|uniref:3-deoxy-D-manno-octulosonate 8-phosphate phosphatase KdsC n=1 Tax=Stieleria marina TaxID=1930275 RepID=A0A517NSC2_9BACT|nr:3-deoxy-D-manno-octulosonate 8-phosphate phosphatase KdsC [Planctomycetes bacterium K23_9]
MPSLLRSDSDIANSITCIISDVDGVLTDGRIIYDGKGVESKQFHVRDGLGIKLWMQSGYEFCILTSRQSTIVEKRSAELGIKHVAQGHAEKGATAQSMMDSLGCSAEQVCYIGDDLPDIPVMNNVGLAVAPADAANDARDAAHWILKSGGGEGAVRELVERLLRAKKQWEACVPS